MFFQEQEVKKKQNETGKKEEYKSIGNKELLKRVIKRNPRITDVQQP